MSPQARTYPAVKATTGLQAWRERALRTTLLATLGVGGIPLLLTLRDALHVPRHWPAALFFLVVYLGLVPLLALRHLDHRLRAWGLFLAGYAAGGLALARGGLAGSGRLYLLALPAVAIALVGVRSGMAAALLSLLTYGGFTITAGQAWLDPWLVHPASLLSLSDWFYEGATFGMLLAVVTLVVGLLVREQARALARAKQAEAALEAAQHRLLTAREEERCVLAWELHDGPLQDLVALGYRLCECRERAWPHEPALAQTLEEVRREATRIMRIVRDACAQLRSDVLDVMGLGPALAQYAYDVMQKTGVVVYLDVPRHGPKLADPLGITLFRVFQEALKNAVEHAGVREVWVHFRLEGGEYELRVWDEGRGFVVPERLDALALNGHFGLMIIRERVAMVGGHLEVRSAPGEGTEVRVWGEVDNELRSPPQRQRRAGRGRRHGSAR